MLFSNRQTKNTLLALNKALTMGVRSEKDETNLVDAEKFAKYAEKLLMTKTGEKFLKTLSEKVLDDVSARIENRLPFFGRTQRQYEWKRVKSNFVKICGR